MKVESVKYMVMVQDMGRGIAFYKDVMGLEVKFTSEMWTELGFGDATIALHGGGSGEFSSTGLSCQVNDIETACNEVRVGGGKVLSGPSDRPGEPIKLANLVDTEGNGFMLSQYVG